MAVRYDYSCTTDPLTEVQQSMGDNALSVCPQRGCRRKAQRVMSRFGVALKGEGFHNTTHSSGQRGRSW